MIASLNHLSWFLTSLVNCVHSFLVGNQAGVFGAISYSSSSLLAVKRPTTSMLKDKS